MEIPSRRYDEGSSRIYIMVDAKYFLKENLKEFMKNIVCSVKLPINEAFHSLISLTIHTTLIPNLQMKPITQDTYTQHL